MLFFFPPDMVRPASLKATLGAPDERTRLAGWPSGLDDRIRQARGASRPPGGPPAVCSRSWLPSPAARESLITWAPRSPPRINSRHRNRWQPLPRPLPRRRGPHRRGQGLGSLVEALKDQLKALQGKVDGLPKPAPTPDLKPVQTKIDELAKALAAVEPVADRLNKLDTRVGGLDTAVKSFQDRFTGLTAELQKIKATPKPSDAAVRPRASATLDPAALSEAVGLFKAGNYPEADNALKQIEASGVGDARVIYYQAFAHALTTGDWRGEEVTRLAGKGAALEKAGKPAAADIDAAFADLQADLKPWLAFFRRGVN